MYVSVGLCVSLCLSVCATCVWRCLWKPIEGILSRGSKGIGSWEPLGRWWELKLSPLKEEQVLLTTETFLQPHMMFLVFSKFESSGWWENNGMCIVPIIGGKCQQTFSSYYLSIFKRTFQSNISWSIHFPLSLWPKAFNAKYKSSPNDAICYKLESQSYNTV